jgi:hypothetical protein
MAAMGRPNGAMAQWYQREFGQVFHTQIRT